MKSGRSAIAKYAARGKQYLVMLRPMDDALVMQQLRYADEIRSISDVPLGDAKVKAGELELALQIVDQAVSDKFTPERYEDEVRQRILTQIERKVEGQEISTEPTEEPRAQVIDLMQALKSSLARKGAGERRPAKRSKASEAKTAARRTTRKKAKSSGR
jgi:DNA end-binding protein Ku